MAQHPSKKGEDAEVRSEKLSEAFSTEMREYYSVREAQRNALVCGESTPEAVRDATQDLISSGWYVRTAADVRKLQERFNLGVDCGNYADQATAAALGKTESQLKKGLLSGGLAALRPADQLWFGKQKEFHATVVSSNTVITMKAGGYLGTLGQGAAFGAIDNMQGNSAFWRPGDRIRVLSLDASWGSTGGGQPGTRIFVYNETQNKWGTWEKENDRATKMEWVFTQKEPGQSPYKDKIWKQERGY